MAKFAYLTLCFIFISYHSSMAQKQDYSKGRVLDNESKQPLSDVNVKFYQSNSVLYQTHTDTAGYFYLPNKLIEVFNLLKIDHLGYSSIEIKKDKMDSKSLTSSLGQFELKRTAFLLKEVVIEKDRQYSDTSIIDLSKENFHRSIMIDDLFSMNGLSKDKYGQLFFKGKPISNITLNGSDFFGKNNTKIYDKLPALTLENIEIVETNIDSITNTTMLNPIVKLNLKVKEKYLKGKFGSISAGLGTIGRTIFSSDLYSYNRQQQISLTGGTNNIGISDNLGEPILNFSATGNRLDKKYAKLTYRNLFYKKIEVNFSSKINREKRISSLESERSETAYHQFSKTKNATSNTILKVEDLNLNVLYKPNAFNSIYLENSFKYEKNKAQDTLDYSIESDQKKTISNVNKLRTVNRNILSNGILYEKRDKNKRGRLFQIDFNSTRNDYQTNEVSKISDFFTESASSGYRTAYENNAAIKTSFTEPLGKNGYIKLVSSLKEESLNYSSLITDTSNTDHKEFTKIKNTYLLSGLMLQKTLKTISFSGTVKGIFNWRTSNIELSTKRPLLNFDIDFRVDQKLSSKKMIQWGYTKKTEYPTASQLTSINSTFDLISISQGNVNLKPEIKHSLTTSYDFRKNDSLSILIVAQIDQYDSKFGTNSLVAPGNTQFLFIDNIGRSHSAQFTLAITKTFKSIGAFNYSFTFNYNESPTILNAEKSLGNGINLGQTISKSIYLAPFLNIAPTIAATYSKTYYNSGPQTSAGLTYTDRISAKLWGIEINNYPLINTTKSTLTNRLSWAVNSELRKSVFKKYGTIWLKAYDIFNSFQFQYDTLGPNYVQSSQYSNLHRYFLLGFTMKINNIR